MGIGQLTIQTTPARLSINRTPEQQSIQQEQYTLNLETSLPKVRVESTLPKITIDQSQPFAESGRKGIADLMAENVSYSVNQMYASIGRIAEQGTQMTNVHINPNAISDQAYYNAYEQFDREWNYGTMPRSRPRIDVIEGQVDIQVTEGRVNNYTQKSRVDYNYTPSKVQVAVAQYHSININYVPKVDYKL